LPQTEQSLDRGSHVTQELFSPLEVRHRLLEAARLLLELVAPCSEQLLQLLFGAGGMREDTAGDVDVARSLELRLRLVGSASPRNKHDSCSFAAADAGVASGRLIHSRRSQSSLPASGEFVGPRANPAPHAERGSRIGAREPISEQWMQKAHGC
jgi:hypothetical protein